MASATGIPETNGQADEEQPLLGQPGDVTQKHDQGLQYNFLTGTAVVAQAGIWILGALVWAAVFEHPPISFFAVHPLVNSAGVLFLVQAILVLQPTSTQSQKIQGTYVHSALNLISVALLLTGLIVIEMNKASHPESRFTSVHGIMGLVTYILIFSQAIVGFLQFYVPITVFGSVDSAKALYKYHRVSGYAVMILILATVCAATQTTFNKSNLHIRLWAVLVASVLVLAGVLPRIKLSKLKGVVRHDD